MVFEKNQISWLLEKYPKLKKYPDIRMTEIFLESELNGINSAVKMLKESDKK